MTEARENGDGKQDETRPGSVEVVQEPAPGQEGEATLVLARKVLPSKIPILPLKGRPLFPRMMTPLVVEEDNLKQMVAHIVESKSKHIGLVLRRNPGAAGAGAAEAPAKAADIYSVGVVGEIVQAARAAPDAPIQIVVGVHERIRIESVVQEQPFLVADVRPLYEPDLSVNEELKAYSLAIINCMRELISLNPLFKEELNLFLNRTNISQPGILADFASAMTSASPEELQEVLETVSVPARIKKVLLLLKKEVDISKLQQRITKQIEEKLSKQQREFFLREQLKEIKKELGLSKEGKEAEVERFAERLTHLTLPQEAQERVQDELDKFKLLEPASPEFNVTRTYLDWLTVLPWGVFTRDSCDLARAKRVLDRDHYGLKDVKDRILEFLAVGIQKGRIAGSILCFVGPPGVGKTSLGQSIARSIGRKFYRFSVGGMKDEAEIKGHRRTYIGALPGKFIQAMRVCKTANPVIMIDEIDKIGASFQGDPAAALLEVLDPEQNREFLDHYLDVRFDLSNVMFICTANVVDTIPRPLLDRMELITLAGYIMAEKVQIGRRHIIPKQMEANGLSPRHFAVTDAALRAIIDGYAREPGVRSLENRLKQIMRKSVKRIVEQKARKVTVDAADVRALLGPKLFEEDQLFKTPRAGVVTGLAWTNLGGTVLFVEATQVNSGKGGFKQTGQLGNVMVESSEIAYTFVRSFLGGDEKARDFFNTRTIHLHVPAGATPKDGPSAGITMAAALYSLALDRPPKRGFAMTGELTLTGLVMPVGGIKEKLIAAHRAGIRRIILPEANMKDLEEIPAHIKRGLRIRPVRRFEDVADICFPLRRARRVR